MRTRGFHFRGPRHVEDCEPKLPGFLSCSECRTVIWHEGILRCPSCGHDNEPPTEEEHRSRLDQWTVSHDVDFDGDGRLYFVRQLHAGYARGYTSWRIHRPHFYKQVVHHPSQSIANPMTLNGPNPWTWKRHYCCEEVVERERRRQRGPDAKAEEVVE